MSCSLLPVPYMVGSSPLGQERTHSGIRLHKNALSDSPTKQIEAAEPRTRPLHLRQILRLSTLFHVPHLGHSLIFVGRVMVAVLSRFALPFFGAWKGFL